MLMNFLPLVHLVRSVPQQYLLFASISVFIDGCRMDRQMTHIRSFRVHPFSNALTSSKEVVSSASPPMDDSQATAVKIPVDRKYAPVPINSEQGRIPDGMKWAQHSRLEFAPKSET